MTALALLVAALAAAAAFATPAGATRTVSCGSASVGPGVRHGGTAGAACLLRAYSSGCRSAGYRLSVFGVDTIATETFAVVHAQGRCAVTVTRAFRVVPQAPRITGHARCTVLRKRTHDIVAAGCTGTGIAASISLTRA